MIDGLSSNTEFYLTFPKELPAGIAKTFASVLERTEISCVLLRHNSQKTSPVGDAKEIVGLCQRRGIPVVLEAPVLFEENSAKQCVTADIFEPGLDGLHLRAGAGCEAVVKTARQNLAARQILGVDVGSSRHNAMLAGQAGADYIGFSGDQLCDMVAWWTPLFQLPCVAFNVENLDLAQKLAKLGCDFVANAGSVWLTADDPVGYFEAFEDQLRDVHNI